MAESGQTEYNGEYIRPEPEADTQAALAQVLKLLASARFA